MQGNHQAKEKAISKNDVTCPQCYKILRTNYSLRRHIRQMHDNQGRFECTRCQRSFSAKGSLDYHVRVKHSVSEDVSLQCEKCNISCTDLQDLKIHKKTHVQNFKMKCHLCSLMLKKKSLAGHIIEVHNIELRYDADKLNFPVYPYECTQCDFVCKRKNDLERHHRAKHTSEEFICKECGKKFGYAKTLRRRMKFSHSSVVDNWKVESKVVTGFKNVIIWPLINELSTVDFSLSTYNDLLLSLFIESMHAWPSRSSTVYRNRNFLITAL